MSVLITSAYFANHFAKFEKRKKIMLWRDSQNMISIISQISTQFCYSGLIWFPLIIETFNNDDGFAKYLISNCNSTQKICVLRKLVKYDLPNFANPYRMLY